MVYKLASRDNADNEVLEIWPAVLSNTFKKYNNRIEKPVFHTEDDILNWLESRTRSKFKNRHTNIQEFRNGDPNKLYSVYKCNHDNPNHNSNSQDIYLYSLRYKKTYEAASTFLTESNKRINSSFKKINILLPVTETVEYSSEPRLIDNSYFEGIFPLDIDVSNSYNSNFMDYVMDINQLDLNNHKTEYNDKEYSIVYANKENGTLWLENFINKLLLVEKYLFFFANGGNVNTKLDKDLEHEHMSRYIIQIMNENNNNEESRKLHKKIRNLIADPYLCNEQVYQIRYNKTFMTWHRNYSKIIQEYKVIPSKTFSDMILNFNLEDFFSQIQTKENLATLIKNLETIYQIGRPNNNELKVIGQKVFQREPKFLKVVRSFNDLKPN